MWILLHILQKLKGIQSYLTHHEALFILQKLQDTLDYFLVIYI
jgi:hypothetical protein